MSVWPFYNNHQINIVNRVIKSNKVNYWTGKESRKFENEFSNKIKLKYGVSVANGTLALEIALKALKLNLKDEVIVTPRSYIASAICVHNIGSRPVFADINTNSQNITLDTIKEKVTKNTKAIICVHLAGFPCDMLEIVQFAKRHKIKIIEDCSQAHGSKINNSYVGSFGDISIWSFCNDKIISTLGEGGMICTNNKIYWKKIWSLKDCGKNYDSVFNKKHPEGFRWIHDFSGTNARLTEVQSAVGRYQLKQLDKWSKKRFKYSQIIWNYLNEIKAVQIPQIPKNYFHSSYRCNILLNPKFIKKNYNRDKILKIFAENKIKCFVGSCPEIYNEKIFKKINHRPKKRLKNAKYVGENSLSFLVHPTLSENNILNQAKKIKKILIKISK